jgi:hypothetical protein
MIFCSVKSAPWGHLWVVALGAASAALAQGLPPDLNAQGFGAARVCRAGYLAFEAAHGLEGLRVALRQAAARGDSAALTFLRERLAERIGADAGVALTVVGWAEGAAEPEVSLLLQAVRETEAVRSPEVVARLFTLAETHPDAGHRVLALVALETQRELAPEWLERLTRLARASGAPPGVAWHAVRTLGHVGAQRFQHSGDLEPYLTRLLEVAGAAAEVDLRSLAVEMLTYPQARLEGPAVAGLARVMKRDPSPKVREMAALALSSGRDTGAVLAHYREAFTSEEDLCVRAALVRYAVRAGGPQALPVVRELARADPRFQPDVADYQRLYASGLTDFDRIWLSKPVRHPRCQGGAQ